MKTKNGLDIRVLTLAGVSAVALIAAAGAAWAAPAPQTNYSLDLTGVTATVANQTQYLITAGVPQLNTGDVAGTITGSSVTNTFGNSAGFPAQASNNIFSATAISLRAIPAPGYDYIANLGAIGNTGTNDGIGILHSQLTGNAGTGTPVTTIATINGPQFTNTINNTSSFNSGSIDTSNNAATATVTVNQISPDYEVRGTVPTGYSSAVHGSAVTGFENSTLSATNSASVAVSSAQTAFNAGSYSGSNASVSDASIGDTVREPGPSGVTLSVTAPQTVDGNTVQANFTVNSAHNIFLAESGDNPTFNGSVLVSTNQANVEQGGNGAVDSASVSDANIFIDNTSHLGTGYVRINGAADVSNNTIGAAASGNVAGTAGVDGGAPTVGSAIILQNGVNFAGTGSTAGNSLSVPQSPNNTLHSTLSGDLILGNGQGNTSTSITSSVTGSGASITSQDLGALGSATLNGNAISGSATGNSAVGAIQALGGSSFSGTAVYGSLQVNDSTVISSNVTGNGVSTTLAGGPDGIVDGVTTLNNNTINASATGNTAGDPTVRSIAIDAANFNSTPGLATIDNVTQWKQGSPVQASTGGGISASNVQGNWGDAPIAATASDNGVTATYNDRLNLATVTASGNAIGATASGNVGYTSVALTGSQGALSAGVSNAQYENNPVTATADSDAVSVTVLGQSRASTITLNNNSLSASAAADSAVNSLSVTGFSTLTLGAVGDSGLATNSHYDVGSPTFTNEVIGALALNNHQTNDGNVSAAISTPLTGLVYALVDGNLAVTAPVTITGNTAGSSAIGAQATNTLTLSPGTLTTASGGIDQIATLGSIQYQGGTANSGVAISSTVDLSAASGAFGAAVNGFVDASPVSVSGNGVSAFAAGNIGNNTLTVTGTNYAAADNGTPLAGVQQFGLRVQAEFALQNGQFDNSPANGQSAGSRTATITDGNVGIALTADATVGTSALTVSGNSLDTDARNNYASNSLNLTGFSTLSTSAGVLNFQNSISTVSSSVVEGKIGIDADGYDVTNSPLTVSDNSSQARAIANTAFNTLSVGAGNLGGNSGTSGASNSRTQLPESLLPNQSISTGDYVVNSYQGTVQSTTASVSGVFQLDLGNGALSGGSATLAGNSMKALSENNNGVNTLNIAAGTTTALSGALMSEQRSTAPTTSATAGYGADGAFGGVQVGSTSGAPISVSSNTLSAMATNNDVTNTLSASATSNLTGQGSIGNATVANTGPVVSVTADYSLFNVQDAVAGTGGIGGTSATANPGQWGVNVDGTTVNSAITVQNNSVTAQSHVNDASNTLSLGGTNVSASGALSNWQASTNSSTATISGGSVGFTGGSSITSSPLNVSGNSFIASAGGNGSTNSLNVTATSYTAPINGGVASGGTVSGGGYQATAAYAVLNMQQNTGAVTSSVGAAGAGNGLNIGINMGGGTPSAVTSSPMTVSGNTVVASAYGSNASNTITMSAGIGTLPSASLTSSQVNSGAITSTVTGANIGINVGANTGSSGVSSNNNVGAISIGNSAGNTIGIR